MGRRSIDVPRQFILLGATNKDDWLNDETGGRRFWPIKVVGRVDIPALERERDQLWAEARELYERDYKWWLADAEEVALATGDQEARYSPGPWDNLIASFASGQPVVDVQGQKQQQITIHQILDVAIAKPKHERSQANVIAVARALKHQGWERFRSPEAGRPWKYRRAAE